MRRALLSVLLCAACASRGGWEVSSGSAVAREIKPLLADGHVRHVILLRRGHAYRVHHSALLEERASLVEALLRATPDNKTLTALIDVEPEEQARPVVKQQYPTRVLSLSYMEGTVHVVRLGGGVFEVWLSERGPREKHRVYLISGAEAVDRAWVAFEDAAVAQAGTTEISDRWWQWPPVVIAGYAEWFPRG